MYNLSGENLFLPLINNRCSYIIAADLSVYPFIGPADIVSFLLDLHVTSVSLLFFPCYGDDTQYKSFSFMELSQFNL